MLDHFLEKALPRLKNHSITPSLCWKNFSIHSNKDLIEHSAIDLSSIKSFEETIHSLHPTLGLADLSLFFNQIQRHQVFLNQFDIPYFFKLYNFHFNENMEKTLVKLSLCPIEFHHWCSQKKVGLKDLRPLNLISNLDGEVKNFLIQVAQSDLNKNQGTQMLDMGMDLFLMKQSPLQLDQEDSFSWAKRIRTLRLPQAALQEEKKQKNLKYLGLPKNVSAQWKRQLDALTLEIKVSSSSPEELQKTLEKLTTFHKNSSHQEALWNR